MGRKANFDKKEKKGKGRKAKKQPPPEFAFMKEDKEGGKLSSNQKKRSKKRALKIEEKVERKFKKQKLSEDEVKKPEPEEKTKLLFASDSEPESDGELPSDEDDLSFAQKAKKLVEEEQQRDEDNLRHLESMKENICIEIPSLEEVKTELAENPDFDNLKSWIKDIAYILADFKKRSNGRRRHELLDILKACLCYQYSYNEWLMDKLMSLFKTSDFLDYLEANEVARPMTLRTNSLKTRRADLFKTLLQQGVDVQTLNWSDVGLIVYKSNISMGATLEYFTGQYMIQGASSFLSVMALNPQPNEVVVDVCAAPGGKSAHIAALMKNTGVLCSNDKNKDRTKALIGNLHRMGVKNTIITNIDATEFGKKMPNRFDRALVDAPCTGTGVISKDPNVKCSRNKNDVLRCSAKQREILLNAIDAVDARSRTGGYIVYSTCSILVEENEAVIDYVMKNRQVKCVPTGLEIGADGFVTYFTKKFHPSLKNSRRIYPHLHNMDGFYVALLKKTE